MAQAPSTPKGTRDFSPAEMIKRNYIFDTIKGVFRKYGYQPLETPAMENLSTLMGKYGEEGDKLLFKILNSGDFLKKLSAEDISKLSSAAAAVRVSEKGLRYDLTVPFARFVVQNQNSITFPFRRYQIQPVWRADRPQKGRYREFYQCDVDVVGSKSLINEFELIQIVEEVFKAFGVNITLKINNRKILFGIAESVGFADKMVDITVAIDKLDKIGLDAVKAELSTKELTQEAIEALEPILKLEGTNREKLCKLSDILSSSPTGLKGIEEISEILDYIDATALVTSLELDLSLARGLSYYTGAIFEVKANDFAIGSICGGGRYDDLTGIFGLKDMSGVGISFGADRIYDVLTGLDLYPKNSAEQTKVIFLNFGKDTLPQVLSSVAALRSTGIVTELYLDSAKIKKQMDYANKRSIPYVVIIGQSELERGVANIKDMVNGQQQEISIEQLTHYFAEIFK